MNLKIDRDFNSQSSVEHKSLENQSKEFGFSWLDSSMQIGDKGLNSYLYTNPVADIYLLNEKVHFNNFKQTIQIEKSANIYDLIEQLVTQYDLIAVGYISYESSLKQFGINQRQDNKLPSIRFLLYEDINQYSNVNQNELKNRDERSKPTTTLKSSISKERYISDVLEIKDYIKEGDIYQANYTTRFEITSSLSPFESYQRLRDLNPSPYSAFINFGDYQILSSSPERIFTIEKNRISSCPIKGTIQLGNTEQEKQKNLEILLNSAKDRAELLMIVDLMRNDIGKIAQTGTVSVDSIFKPEIYSSLIHLVSEISANLKTDVSFNEIIESLVPGGSITGTPKKRAIEIINEIENSDRFIYTGSIGYFSKEKKDFNIAIRTMYHTNNSYYIHAGGGIIADSNPEDEYNEMLLKAKNLFKAVGYLHA